MAKHYEIAIIGGGPGGISAAASAAANNLDCVLFERAEIANTIYDYQLGKHVMAEPGNLPLRAKINFEAGSREEVLESWNNSISEFNIPLIKQEVIRISKTENGFEVKTKDSSYRADKVILSIGLQGTPRKLDVPGKDLPHVTYTLTNPKNFSGKHILVIGAGDSALENALALAKNNQVSLLNRSNEFPRAKDANVKLINDAIAIGKIKCFYDSSIKAITLDKATLDTRDGELTIDCEHIIARIGAIMPRKFLESCGIEFPGKDIDSVPVVDRKYESNVAGLYLIGSLIGYPLIKQAINQGYEVIEHIIGKEIEPADQTILAKKLKDLPGTTNEKIERIRESLPLFSELSIPQFREVLSESKIHQLNKNEVIFKKNDYTDTVFSIIDGSAAVEVATDQYVSLDKGEFFGEVGLISGRRRNATVRAGANCVLLETQRRQILKLIRSVKSVKEKIDQKFVYRILKTSVFPNASEDSIRKLLPNTKSQSFKKNEVLFNEGEAGDKLYVIRKGSVKVSRKTKSGKDLAQTYIAAGNFVGEMALLGPEGSLRTATITAAVPCDVLYIERVAVKEFLSENPDTKKKLSLLADQRRVENVIFDSNPDESDLLEFIFNQGITDAENVLLIDSDICIGCDNCEKACAATHDGYSRLDRKGGKSLASIQIPISCRHCENPLCMLDCPPDALERLPNGEVIIKESCIGCGNCQTNCPYGVIQMVYENQEQGFSLFSWFKRNNKDSEQDIAKAAKCDMCSNLSGGPACVRSCPTGAALRVNPSEMMQMLEAKRNS